jgi:hypothetical protein
MTMPASIYQRTLSRPTANFWRRRNSQFKIPGSGLTGAGAVLAYDSMKTKISALLAVAGLAVCAAGCVHTVDDRSEVGVPLVPDKAVARYPRSVPQVLDAASAVLRRDGSLVANNTLNNSLEARVNKHEVWVKVTAEDPAKPISDLTVEARNDYGGTDRDLAYQIREEITLQLSH